MRRPALGLRPHARGAGAVGDHDPVHHAITVGETAPLLTTAGWSAQVPSLSPTHSQLGYLPYPSFSFYQFGKASVALSYDSALILLVIVLILIIVGRVVIAVSRRHAE